MMDRSFDPNTHFEAVANCARDAIIILSADSTIQYANPAVESIFGYEPENVIGESISVLLSEDDAETLLERFDQYLTTGDRSTDWGDIRLQGVCRSGETIPLSISLSDFTRDETTYFSGIFRDVSEQQRREIRLTELNRLAQDLTNAESFQDICQRTVDAAQAIFDHPIASIELYDADDGQLVPCAWTSDVDGLSDEEQLFASERSVPWNAFVTQERTLIPDLESEPDVERDETPLRSVYVQPLGSYGVFVAGATETNAFDESTVDSANILVGNAYSSLERVDREESLREQRDQLADKTASIDRVRRINTVIRDLTKALTQASSRKEILSEVCTRLAASEPYQFAWFGSVDQTDAEIVSQATSGGENGFLDEFEGTDNDGFDHGLIDRVVDTRSPQVQNSIYQDPPFEPWRQAAIERGYRATIGVPVVHQDTFYGVINLYAAEEDVFEQMEVTVLKELGETIGYALNADERKQAFTSDRSVELAFEVTNFGESLLGLGLDSDGSFELENLVERRDGTVTMFFTADEPEPDDILEWLSNQPQVLDSRLVTDRTDDRLFESRLERSTIWAQLLQRGSIVCEAQASGDSARLVIRIPRSADPRSYDALLEEWFDDVELVARREFDEPVMAPEEFEAELHDRLTERQEEVLETAYYAGYFEWPRETDSKELAETLGIAQPTMSRHLRSSEQKFLSMLYDDT
ncbi:PAS domain S-box-containing protein [Natronorubrum sediminis]|uniref:PAS domain S-box-containing protein n=1 Tax=Natronorubrum sediminis TaxID=640943 RepID=A0A1H6G5Z6_9EURY|nr:bacterio-opsin activator domain-containing protein [Natronorubrum sediminis]SEH18002.1 PAS domain S-box-containing protein [Natronorubrum sediminis]